MLPCALPHFLPPLSVFLFLPHLTTLLLSPEDLKEREKTEATKKESNLFLIMDGIADLSQEVPSLEYVLLKWMNRSERGREEKKERGKKLKGEKEINELSIFVSPEMITLNFHVQVL